jgi:hypothetical protein
VETFKNLKSFLSTFLIEMSRGKKLIQSSSLTVIKCMQEGKEVVVDRLNAADKVCKFIATEEFLNGDKRRNFSSLPSLPSSLLVARLPQ